VRRDEGGRGQPGPRELSGGQLRRQDAVFQRGPRRLCPPHEGQGSPFRRVASSTKPAAGGFALGVPPAATQSTRIPWAPQTSREQSEECLAPFTILKPSHLTPNSFSIEKPATSWEPLGTASGGALLLHCAGFAATGVCLLPDGTCHAIHHCVVDVRTDAGLEMLSLRRGDVDLPE
jgi:hypothetical protein